MIRKLVRGPVALVDIPAPGAEGVLFAHGSRFGRHALYVKDNRLYHAYNFVGIFEQKIDGTEDVPAGENLILSASFDKDGEDPPGVSTGLLSLYQGEKKVGERRTKTQPGLFSIAGEGLCVGRDSGEHVTSDYPGDHPHTFTGGAILVNIYSMRMAAVFTLTTVTIARRTQIMSRWLTVAGIATALVLLIGVGIAGHTGQDG